MTGAALALALALLVAPATRGAGWQRCGRRARAAPHTDVAWVAPPSWRSR